MAELKSPFNQFNPLIMNSPFPNKPEFDVNLQNPDLDRIPFVRTLIFKIIIAGPDGVGKTALVEKFCRGEFITDQKLTDRAAVLMTDVTLFPGESCRMQFHIVRYPSSLSDYCRAAAGALLCFDLTDNATFLGLPTWVKQIKDGAGSIPIMLVGTKWDLPNHKIDLNTAGQYAETAKCEAGVVFCSAKENINVEETFYAIGKWVVYRLKQAGRNPKPLTI